MMENGITKEEVDFACSVAQLVSRRAYVRQVQVIIQAQHSDIYEIVNISPVCPKAITKT